MKSSASGWNFGNYEFIDKECLITLDELHLLSIPYDRIAIANHSSNNDAVIEFNTEDIDKAK